MGMHKSTVRELKAQSLSAVKWVYLRIAVIGLLGPIRIVILARLLTPSDFGLAAVAMTALSLFAVFQDLGLAKALVQADQDDAEVLHIVFWFSALISAVLCLLLVLSAPLVAGFFSAPDAVLLVRVLALKVLIDGLAAAPKSALSRRLDFRSLFLVQAVPAVVSLVVTTVLAYLAWGAWALAAGNLAAAACGLLLAWMNIPLRPAFRKVDRARARPLVVFGLWSTVETLVAWFYMQGDSALVGHYFPPDQFGTYVVGSSAMLMLLGVLLAPVGSLAYPTFSKLQSDRGVLGAALLDMTRMCAVLCVPAGVGIFLLADSLTAVFFSSKWAGLAPILGVLGLAEAAAWIMKPYPDAYRASGRPDIVSTVLTASLLYAIPAYVLAARFGLQAFVWAKLAVVLVGVAIWLRLSMRSFRLSSTVVLQRLRTPLLATAGMAFAILVLDRALQGLAHPSHLVRLLVLVPAGVLAYAAVFYRVDAGLFRQLRELVRQALPPGWAPDLIFGERGE